MSVRVPDSWKGIGRGVLLDAGVYLDGQGLVHLPCRSADGRSVLRERIVAPGGRRWWGPGEGVHLFGLERLSWYLSRYPLLVCEGESDALAAIEEDWQAVGVPGAHTFRPEWLLPLQRFDLIYAIGDGDDAGLAFSWSVRRVVPWARPVVCPEGRDLRDLIQSCRLASRPTDESVERPGVTLEAMLDDADYVACLDHALAHAPDPETAARWVRR